MEQEIVLDTTQLPDVKSRIEYRILETQGRLLQANVKYNKWAFVPAITANGAYNFNFQNKAHYILWLTILMRFLS
jgi:hypothetical protein